MSLKNFVKKNKAAFDDYKMPEEASLIFEEKLKNELHSSNSIQKTKVFKYASIAASFLLLVTFGYLFNENKKEQLVIRDNLVQALNKEQTNSSRLEVIYEIEDEYLNKKEDENILNAFFKILNDDSDANSKIAVIDALLKFPDNQSVRNNLINALGNEKEPIVQLKLIKSVALLREQRAKEYLQKIIKDKESLPLVKGNASVLLAMLNQ